MECLVPDEVQQVLLQQSILADGPGSILSDFAALLDFIGTDGIKTAGKYHFIPQSQLEKLNRRMVRPLPHQLKRPQQRSLPPLHGLYLILRASGLARVQGERLLIDPVMLEQWIDLNPTEQYFTLLESWLVEGSLEIVAEQGDDCFDKASWVFQNLPHIALGAPVNVNQLPGFLFGTVDLLTVGLMDLFGLIRLTYGQSKAGGPIIETIERLVFGNAMIAALQAHYMTYRFAVQDDESDQEVGVLHQLFYPYFPEWQRTLEPPDLPYRDGTYTLRVSLGKAWRQIEAPADLLLDDLAMAILDVYEFDADHLYCFELRDPCGRRLRIACPDESDADAFTDQLELGDVPLAEGGSMTFHFDYGYDWQFSVKLETVVETDEKLTEPRLTGQGGKAPLQYDSDDDDE